MARLDLGPIEAIATSFGSGDLLTEFILEAVTAGGRPLVWTVEALGESGRPMPGSKVQPVTLGWPRIDGSTALLHNVNRLDFWWETESSPGDTVTLRVAAAGSLLALKEVPITGECDGLYVAPGVLCIGIKRGDYPEVFKQAKLAADRRDWGGL